MRWAVFSVLTAMVCGGCTSLKGSLGLEEEPPPVPAPIYYDFPDVLIPPELSLDPHESVIYETHGVKGGLLFFKGRVEVESLIDFFKEYLARDGWIFVSSARFSRILLNFSKPDRTCQIVMKDKPWTTEVEVWVNPYKPADQ